MNSSVATAGAFVPPARIADVATGPRVYVVLTGLIVWLALQTPLLTAAYQYLGLGVDAARALLLAKDLAAAGLLVILLVAYARRTRWRFFDVAALLYLGILILYAVVPFILGSNLPPLSVVASLREFSVPVELYAIGRLAATAGVSFRSLALWSIAVSAVAAVVTVGLYLAVPASFWNTTLDLVRFIREVQGIPTAVSLWSASLVGHFGIGASVADAIFPRAVGPFTHPVGTAHYFVVPLVLVFAAAATASATARWTQRVLTIALLVLLALAVITPISRAAWLAALAAIAVAAVLLNRIRWGAAVIAAFAAFVLLVPPFNYSIQSALSLTDSSTIGHVQAIEEGVDVISRNPLGLGVGQGDTLGEVFGGGASAGVGENMYLALMVSVGPLGLIAFVLWIAGVLRVLLTASSAAVPRWMFVGVAAALGGLLLSSATASPLMRFTTSASLWILVGLAVGSIEHSVPLPTLAQVRERMRWRRAQAKIVGSSTR